MILADIAPSGGDCSVVSVLLFASLVALAVVLTRRSRSRKSGGNA